MQTDDILSELNPEQKEAVVYNDGPLLVVAGAGTGKTKVIISKIAYLISEKIAKPSEILAITFTKKAAAEMEERLDMVLPYGYNDVKACNFHSLAEEFLRENAYALGYSTNFKILTEAGQILFIKERIFDFDLKIFRPLSDPTYFIRDLIRVFSRLKDEMISPEQYLKFAQDLENKADSGIEKEQAEEQMELARAYQTYQTLMAESDRMDFGDLIYNMVKALKEKEQLLDKFCRQYRFILVDEFQDTNLAQNELLKVITLRNSKFDTLNSKQTCLSVGKVPNSKNPKDLNDLKNLKNPIITVVGDDDQSIYKFRGAAISNILDFKENWPDVMQVVMTQNYRNTQEILDASYQLIQFNNPDRLEAKYKIDKKLKSNTDLGAKPELLVFENATEEAAAVAEKIQSIKQKNKKTKKQGEDLKYSDFAILIRSNNQASPFLNALSSKKIPYLFSGSEGLFKKSIIKNIIAFFSILTNPTDNLALFNLLIGEFGGIDFDRLSIILHIVRSKNIPLEEYLRSENEKDLEKNLGEENLKNIKEILKILQDIRRESITASSGEILYKFISDSGYLKKLATQEKKGDIFSGEKIISISHFFDRILGFQEANLDVGVQKFMEYLNILLEIGEDIDDEIDDPNYDAVRILTLHKSKGLEFQHVFMVGLSDSKFPSRNQGEPIKIPEVLIDGGVGFDDEEEDKKAIHLQEERRLFYVGMTRAESGLYFTFGRDYGGKKSVKVSRFVLEALGAGNINPEYSKQTELERIEHFAPKKEPLYSTRLKLKSGKLRLSRAEVDDYLTCPRKYKFIHITPIKMMADPKIIFGRAIHKVIEEFYKSKLISESDPNFHPNSSESKTKKNTISKALSLNQLLEIYRQNWSSEGFLSAEHEKQRYDEGIEVIKRFYNDFSEKLNVIEVEKPFKFSIEDNIIEGRIDALEKLSDGGIRVIDFKTTDVGDEKKADEKAKNNRQLAIYSLAISELEGELPKEAGLFFLMDGVVGAFIPTESLMEKTKAEIIRASNGIRAQEFLATPDKRTCEFCTFSRYCDDSVV